MRQQFVHVTDPVHGTNGTSLLDLCSEQPIAICLQEINDPTAVRQVKFDPYAVPDTWTLDVCGNFVQQKFRPGTVNTTLADYDSQRFWANQSGSTSAPAVSTKYLLKNQSFDINMQALGLVGYVQLVYLTYPKGMPFPAHTTGTGGSLLNCQYPNFLVGMCDTTPLSQNMNVFSRGQLKQKVLKSWYFSTGQIAGQPPNSPDTEHARAQFFQTYSRKYWHVKIKHNSVIEVSERGAAGSSYIADNLPLGQQSFLMLRTSVPFENLTHINQPVPPPVPPLPPIPPGSNLFQRLQVEMQRTVSWADQIGNSIG